MRKWKILAIIIFLILVFSGIILSIPFFAEYKFKKVIMRLQKSGQIISYSDFDLKKISEIIVKGIKFEDRCGFNFQIDKIRMDIDPYFIIKGALKIKDLHIFKPDLNMDKFEQCIGKYRRTFVISSSSNKRDLSSGFKNLFLSIPDNIEIENASIKINEPSLFFNKLERGYLSLKNESLFRDQPVYALNGTFALESQNNGINLSATIDKNKRDFSLSIDFRNYISETFERRKILFNGFSINRDGIISLKNVGFLSDENPPEYNFRAKEIKLKIEPSKEKSFLGEKKMKNIMKIFSYFFPLSDENLEIVEFEGDEINLTLNINLPSQIYNKNITTTLSEDDDFSNGFNFQKKASDGFIKLEGNLKYYMDFLYKSASILPLRKINIAKGKIKYVQMGVEEKPFNEWSGVYINAEKEDKKYLKFNSEFTLPDVEGKKNIFQGSIDALKGDIEIRAQLEEFPVYEYRFFFPSFLELLPDTMVHHSNLRFKYNKSSEEIELNGEFYISNVNVFIPQIASKTMRKLNLGLSLNNKINLKENIIEFKNTKFYMNKILFNIDGLISNYENSPEFKFEINFPRTRCSDIVESLPAELIPILEGLKVDGSFQFTLNGYLNSTDIASLKYDFKPDLADFIVLDMGKHINFDIIRESFIHRIVEAGGNVIERKMSPNSSEWTPLEKIPAYLILAITTTEDAGFFQHHGFSPYAIRRSLIRNIEKGGFYQGASTISQQLVKNLFLSTEKTISRKLQETFITWQMERFISKEKILELYFNVIEFGPQIYGIKQAAHHYFSKEPSDLNLIECVFLVSVIPNPVKYYKEYERGTISEKWRLKLQRILKAMLERGKITEGEYQNSAPYIPVFVKSE